MGISINTNIAATKSSYYLAQNHQNLQKSLDRLSSGRRITEPADDAGGLAVSMKLQGTIDRLNGASSNVANGISFLQVQDGILNSAAQIVARMGELKGLHSDVMKNATDKATYDSEFADLQMQLHQLASTKFNGVDLFAELIDDGAGGTVAAGTPGNGAIFGGTAAQDNTMAIYTTADGSSGNSVAVNRSLLLSALTINAWNDASNNLFGNSAAYSDGAGGVPARTTNTAGKVLDTNNRVWSFAASATADTFSLDILNTSVFTTALENVATLRAENGGSVKRMRFAQNDITTQITNLTAANGRIMDVDVANESSNLARQQVLVQASAAMTAQAKMSTQIALLLLQ